MNVSEEVRERLVGVAELSRITSLKRTAIYSRIKAGEFRPIKLGKKTVFAESEVRAWVAARVNPQA